MPSRLIQKSEIGINLMDADSFQLLFAILAVIALGIGIAVALFGLDRDTF